METNDGVPMSEEQEVFFRRLEWDEKHPGLRVSPLYATESYGFSFAEEAPRIKEAPMPDKDYPHSNCLLRFNWNSPWVRMGIKIVLGLAVVGACTIIRWLWPVIMLIWRCL